MRNNSPFRSPPLLLWGAAISGVPALIPGLVPPWLAFAAAATILAASVLEIPRRFLAANPFRNSALACLIIPSIPLALLASPLLAVSLQGAAVFAWSAAAMLSGGYWMIQAPEQRPAALLSAVSIAFAVIALLCMEEMPKFPFLDAANGLLPHLGGFAGIPEGGIPANELGGIAAWLVPVLAAVTISNASPQHSPRIVQLAALVLTGVVLLLSQSRGAYMAALAGLVVGLLLSGTSARIVLGLLLTVLVAGVALSGFDSVTNNLVYHRRYDSFFPLLTGRDELWLRAWMLINDVPLFGAGFGTFGSIVADVYPFRFALSVHIEDAHNLYLQTALDLGIAGAVLFLAFLTSVIAGLIRALRNGAPLAAALLGGCTAYMLYNFTDAVSLGSPGTAIAFLLFAAAGVYGNNTHGTHPRRAPAIAAILLFLVVAATAALMRPPSEQWALLRTIAALEHSGDTYSPPVEINAPPEASPAALWYGGMLDRAQGTKQHQILRWKALAGKAPAYIPYMANAEPHNEALARSVATADPASADVAFWLGRILEQSQPQEAAELFRRGLKASPGDGWAWLGLGNALQAAGDTAAAHRAYTKACFNDDPGLNGCWRAAKTAEALGDTASALKFYDISNFTGAKKRAAEIRALRKDSYE